MMKIFSTRLVFLGLILGVVATTLFSLSLAIAQTSSERQALPDYDREARWEAEVVPGLVVGDAIKLKADGRELLGLLTQGKPERPSFVLVHGVGVHPDFGLIGELRSKLADAGFTTLSIQMPVLAKTVTDANEYARIFPFATNRIQAAAEYLGSKTGRPIILLSHSMGSWMSNVYFEKTTKTPYAAWVCLSITGRIGSTGDHRLPIFDVQGEQDLQVVRRASWLRAAKLLSYPKSKQVEIAGADHHYAGQEQALVKAIDSFVTQLGF